MNGVIKSNSICDWCGHKEPLVAGKKYCSDCRRCCVRECTTCHKPYNNLKYFDGDSKRCKSCTVKNITRKANRKRDEDNMASSASSRPSKRLTIEGDIADSDDGGVFSGKRPSDEGPVRKKKKGITIKQDLPTEEDDEDDEEDDEEDEEDEEDDEEDDDDERGGDNSDVRSVTSSPLTISDNESVEEAPPPPPPPATPVVAKKKNNKKRKEGEISSSKGEAYAKNVFALMKDAALESKKSKVKKPRNAVVGSGKTENPLVSGPAEKKKRSYRKKTAATKTRAQCEKEFVRALVNLNAADPKQTHVNVFFYPSSNYKVPEQQ